MDLVKVLPWRFGSPGQTLVLNAYRLWPVPNVSVILINKSYC